jgi:hypothetical protein
MSMSQTEGPKNSQQPMEENVYPRAAPIMVAVTLILFLSMMALLGYRWLNMAEPNGFILVEGSKDFNGAEATVRDAAGDEQSHGMLNAANDYRLRFPLPQGTYRLDIAMNNQAIIKQSVSLREGNGLVFDLDEQPAATTQPASE